MSDVSLIIMNQQRINTDTSAAPLDSTELYNEFQVIV